MNDELALALQTFVEESRELLQDMEQSLLHIEEQDDPRDTVNAIFRAAHTIKGSSGLFGLGHVVGFTHVVESVLDRLRDGKIEVNPALIASLLPCADHIGHLINEIARGNFDPDPDLTKDGEVLLAVLREFLDGSTSAILTRQAGGQAGPVGHVEVLNEERVESGNWHISLRFGIDSLRNGMDPLAFIRFLATLGDVVHVTTLADAMPAATDMDPESCYLGFEIDINSQATKEAIESVFEFVREDSVIHILPPNSRVSDYMELIRALPEDEMRLGEILVKSGVLTRRELDEGLSLQRKACDAEQGCGATPLGEILVEQQMVQQPIVDSALAKQKQVKDNKARESQTIRVDASRLDLLIDLVGELVISVAGANLRAARSGDTALLESTQSVMRLVEEVRDSALQLRMVQIGTTFSRFQRVVRDVSAELGKEIHLVISGGDTEVDKSVVEKIGDPLMHLVRNSMDHGIEPPAERIAQGKPAQGTLRLNAYHESGMIVIEVGDDGGGLKREKILAKAVERGLIDPSRHLSDKEICELIFEPGFSTADKLSNLSGRGVGMDVVKRNIAALRGSIEIESRENIGTTLRIRLPLTLAIIDGFGVGVGDSTFVVPLDRVVECLELNQDAENQGRDYINLRGEVLPFIRLRKLFKVKEKSVRRENIVVVEYAGNKTGLVVDQLIGEFQTVIKPLGKLFNHLHGIGGSTILGSGEVALIVDVPALVEDFSRRETAELKSLARA